MAMGYCDIGLGICARKAQGTEQAHKRRMSCLADVTMKPVLAKRRLSPEKTVFVPGTIEVVQLAMRKEGLRERPYPTGINAREPISRMGYWSNRSPAEETKIPVAVEGW